jgi:hypothetical protein
MSVLCVVGVVLKQNDFKCMQQRTECFLLGWRWGILVPRRRARGVEINVLSFFISTLETERLLSRSGHITAAVGNVACSGFMDRFAFSLDVSYFFVLLLFIWVHFKHSVVNLLVQSASPVCKHLSDAFPIQNRCIIVTFICALNPPLVGSKKTRNDWIWMGHVSFCSVYWTKT